MHVQDRMDQEEVAIPESWKGVKVRAAPCKAADPPGWNPPGSLTCLGEAGGVPGRQTVPASNRSAPVPCPLIQTLINIK